MIDALEALACEESNRPRLLDRLQLMILNLPTKAARQSVELLGDISADYAQQFQLVINHFRAVQWTATTENWLAVFDQHVTISIKSAAHLIDAHLASQPLDVEKMGDLQSSVRVLIEEIKADQSLDEDTKNYLLEVALHLLQVLQRFDLFGSEGITDLQGHFFSTLVNYWPELIPNGSDGPSPSAGRKFVGRLFSFMQVANVTLGIPASIVAFHLALAPGPTPH